MGNLKSHSDQDDVIAHLRTTINWTTEGLGFLNAAGDHWFAHDGGTEFFRDSSERWATIVEHQAALPLDEYFGSLGLKEDQLPRVRINRSYEGSWHIDGAVYFVGGAASLYAVLKPLVGIGAHEVVADALVSLKDKVANGIRNVIRRRVRDRMVELIEPITSEARVTENLVETETELDEQPLRLFRPEEFQFRTVHLQVSVSRESLIIKNFGDEDLCNVSIGLERYPVHSGSGRKMSSHVTGST